jgi:hypothetical protein
VSGPDCTLLGSLPAVFPQGSRPPWYAAAVSRSISARVPVATRGDRGVIVARSPGAGLPKSVSRGGSRTPDNLTPRPGIDRQGLSTFETLELTVRPGGKAQVIDLSRLPAPLVGVSDAPPPGHISIRPGPALTPEVLHSTAEWAASRGTGILHPYTQALMEAIIGEVRRSK